MREILEGYVVDMHCARSWPHSDLQRRAQEHTTACALRGAHVESGYALIDEEIMPLDASATTMVVHVLREADRERGVRLRVTRRPASPGRATTTGAAMESTLVELAITRDRVQSSNIRSVGYLDRTLEIEFKNGIYQFLDVPETTYEELMRAESQGRFFNAHVRGHFQSRKIA